MMTLTGTPAVDRASRTEWVAVAKELLPILALGPDIDD